jgi:hypothetical protein
MYVFQGLTTDGKYYISAFFPIRSALLVDKYEDAKDFPDLSANNAADLYATYLAQTVDRLNKAGQDSFTPNLDAIDAVLTSLKIQ